MQPARPNHQVHDAHKQCLDFSVPHSAEGSQHCFVCEQVITERINFATVTTEPGVSVTLCGRCQPHWARNELKVLQTVQEVLGLTHKRALVNLSMRSAPWFTPLEIGNLKSEI